MTNSKGNPNDEKTAYGRRHRALVWLGIGILLASNSGVASDWKLVWSDEFDKPGLPDATKWNYETGFIRNNEAQYYTRERKENARVENGILVIEARKEHFPNPDFDPAATG